MLKQHGFIVHAFARVPYLSQGDHRRSFYILDDVMLVLGKDEEYDQQPNRSQKKRTTANKESIAL